MKFNSYFALLLCLFLGSALFTPLRAQTLNNSDFQKGIMAYNNGQYAEALQHFKDAINEDPDSWQSYQLEGYCDYHLGNHDEMMSALNASLKMNPNNPVLVDYVHRLTTESTSPSLNSPINSQPDSATMPQSLPTNPLISSIEPSSTPLPNNMTMSTSNLSNLNPNTTSSIPYFNLMVPGNAFNFHFYTGLDMALMGDLVNGLQNWTNYQKNYTNVLSETDNFSQFGILGGFEFKRSFDNQDISINGEMVTGTGGESDIDLTNGYVGKVIINPTLWEIGLNYTLHFSPQGNLRPYGTLGLGYYVTSVQYLNPYATMPGVTPSEYYGQGTFNASTVGETLGLGLEWVLDRSFTFDIGGRLRLATFNQLISNNFTGTDAPAGTGPYTLEIYNNNLYFVPQSVLNGSSGGHRYAVLDYSGVDLMIGLHFYFGGDTASVTNQTAETSSNGTSRTWSHFAPVNTQAIPVPEHAQPEQQYNGR